MHLARRLARALLRADCTLATAESCTGGWLAKTLTDLAGSSRWFECGYVTYSNTAKIRDLGVAAASLNRCGAVSSETARAMARGALRRARTDLSVAITGIAGPDGGTPMKPVGTVWFAIAVRGRGGVSLHSVCRRFRGDREAVRRKSVDFALRLTLKHLPGHA